MLKIKIADIKQGSSALETTVKPSDIGLASEQEFKDPIDLLISINRISNTITTDIQIQTRIDLVCDRCTEPFQTDFSHEVRFIFTRDSDMAQAEQDLVFVLDKHQNEIDLTEPLRQTMLLEIPFKRICQPECSGLCARCGVNLNKTRCDCKDEEIDPRWEKLRELLNND
jgi:uncharacterized protein